MGKEIWTVIQCSKEDNLSSKVVKIRRREYRSVYINGYFKWVLQMSWSVYINGYCKCLGQFTWMDTVNVSVSLHECMLKKLHSVSTVSQFIWMDNGYCKCIGQFINLSFLWGFFVCLLETVKSEISAWLDERWYAFLSFFKIIPSFKACN